MTMEYTTLIPGGELSPDELAIEDAVEAFRQLLSEQYERASEMKNAKPPKNFTVLDHIKIGLVGGDGIGPYLMRESLRVAQLLLRDELASGKIELVEIAGMSIEDRRREGVAIPKVAMDALLSCDCILKGPTETPKGGTLESANVAMRRALDLYANVRPVAVAEEGIDWTFFRENTEGEYVLGSRGVEIGDTLSMDFKVTTDAGTRRIARAAFEFAKNNGKKSVAIVTKANIMKKTDGNFSRICHEIAADYPDIQAEDWYIDIMTANLINPQIRSRFEVFVLPTLYGDIITDEAAQIQGGVGTAGSANIGDQYAMFEAIHGTAPRMIEDGTYIYANPASLLRAFAMLLRHIGYGYLATRLDTALDAITSQHSPVRMTGTPEGNTTTDFVDALLDYLQRAR